MALAVSSTSGTDCTITNRTSKAEYTRQFASIQKSCSILKPTPAPPPVTAECTRTSGSTRPRSWPVRSCSARNRTKVAESCRSEIVSVKRYESENLYQSSCKYAIELAWYPKNDTATTTTKTRLGQDKVCLPALEYSWMRTADCMWDGKNQHLFYHNQTAPIMDECTALSFTVEYPNGLAPKVGASAASVRDDSAGATSVVLAVLAAVAPVAQINDGAKRCDTSGSHSKSDWNGV